MGIQAIAPTPLETVTYGNLTEDTHFDYFDGMLIWQAICRKMVSIGKASDFRRFSKDGLELLLSKTAISRSYDRYHSGRRIRVSVQDFLDSGPFKTCGEIIKRRDFI